VARAHVVGLVVVVGNVQSRQDPIGELRVGIDPAVEDGDHDPAAAGGARPRLQRGHVGTGQARDASRDLPGVLEGPLQMEHRIVRRIAGDAADAVGLDQFDEARSNTLNLTLNHTLNRALNRAQRRLKRDDDSGDVAAGRNLEQAVAIESDLGGKVGIREAAPEQRRDRQDVRLRERESRLFGDLPSPSQRPVAVDHLDAGRQLQDHAIRGVSADDVRNRNRHARRVRDIDFESTVERGLDRPIRVLQSDRLGIPPRRLRIACECRSLGAERSPGEQRRERQDRSGQRSARRRSGGDDLCASVAGHALGTSSGGLRKTRFGLA
jgi:hypothetical protein